MDTKKLILIIVVVLVAVILVIVVGAGGLQLNLDDTMSNLLSPDTPAPGTPTSENFSTAVFNLVAVPLPRSTLVPAGGCGLSPNGTVTVSQGASCEYTVAPNDAPLRRVRVSLTSEQGGEVGIVQRELVDPGTVPPQRSIDANQCLRPNQQVNVDVYKNNFATITLYCLNTLPDCAASQNITNSCIFQIG